MVDTTIKLATNTVLDPSSVPSIRLHDNGDGTYSMAGFHAAMGTPSDARTIDPDGQNETIVSLLRAILYRLENGVDVNLL